MWFAIYNIVTVVVVVRALSCVMFFYSFMKQIVMGITVFLIPATPVYVRASLMPVHIYTGLFIFTSVIATALMGFTEKLIFAL